MLCSLSQSQLKKAEFAHGVITKREWTCFYSIINSCDGLSFIQSSLKQWVSVFRRSGNAAKRSCVHAELLNANFTFKSKLCSRCSNSHDCVVVCLSSQCLQLMCSVIIYENSSFRRVVSKQCNLQSEKEAATSSEGKQLRPQYKYKDQASLQLGKKSAEISGGFTAQHKTALFEVLDDVSCSGYLLRIYSCRGQG